MNGSDERDYLHWKDTPTVVDLNACGFGNDLEGFVITLTVTPPKAGNMPQSLTPLDGQFLDGELDAVQPRFP